MVQLKVAVAQTCSQQFGLEKTLSKLESIVIESSSNNAKFIVFPEAFIGGYPKHSTFGTQVGNRDASGRDEFLKYYEGAITIPSETTDRISKIAKDNEMSMIIGVIEKDGGTLYCTAIYIDAMGGYVAKHRKLMPTGAERLIWGFGDSSTMKAQDLTICSASGGQMNSVKCSATICWENYMPMLRYHYYQQQIQLYCAPTVDSRKSWIPSMQHIASESRTFVLSACQFARVSDFPKTHFNNEARDADSIIIAGGSCIVNPMGEILAGPLRDTEGILYAEIDLNDIVRAKMDLDVVGHYSRSDIFQLHVK